MHITKRIAFALVIIGALNWGFIGITGINPVSFAFSFFPMIENVIYVLVGLSALLLVFARQSVCVCDCTICNRGKHCEACEKK